jgi:hypothetical protein
MPFLDSILHLKGIELQSSSPDEFSSFHTRRNSYPEVNL